MNQVIKPLVAGSLAFILIALFSNELTSFASRLDNGLVRLRYDELTTPQSKRRSAFVSELFRNNCARCHGADGRADTPLGRVYQTPDLTNPEWWRKNSKITSTASLIKIVSRGKGGMPAFGKKLKRSEIRALVGYVRRFKSGSS
jgi:mono/diheme cytochrome c family protein